MLFLPFIHQRLSVPTGTINLLELQPLLVPSHTSRDCRSHRKSSAAVTTVHLIDGGDASSWTVAAVIRLRPPLGSQPASALFLILLLQLRLRLLLAVAAISGTATGTRSRARAAASHHFFSSKASPLLTLSTPIYLPLQRLCLQLELHSIISSCPNIRHQQPEA